MLKKILCILLMISILIINTPIFADDIDEDLDFSWVQEEIVNVSANPTKEPNILSRYAVVFDRNSKEIIYGKKENEEVPMASTTKIMTAIVLMENIEKNNLQLDTQIEVCKEAGSIQGSRLGLKKGDKITINDLLYGLMLCSRK